MFAPSASSAGWPDAIRLTVPGRGPFCTDKVVLRRLVAQVRTFTGISSVTQMGRQLPDGSEEGGTGYATASADERKRKRPARGGPEIHVETWRRRD